MTRRETDDLSPFSMESDANNCFLIPSDVFPEEQRPAQTPVYVPSSLTPSHYGILHGRVGDGAAELHGQPTLLRPRQHGLTSNATRLSKNPEPRR